jgi:DNA-binding response OmpR family regulator
MRELLVTGLRSLGIPIEGVADGEALERAVAEGNPDIILLDIGLPGEDGLTLAARLRRDHPHLGIILLTSRDKVEDRIRGLDTGADLYFAKPADLREVASGIGSLHRRLGHATAWRLDSSHSRLHTPGGATVDLTDLELRFLSPLLERPGSVVDREDLCRALGYHPDLYAMRRMETLLSRLRSKVARSGGGEPLPVKARHGRGYAFLG